MVCAACEAPLRAGVPVQLMTQLDQRNYVFCSLPCVMTWLLRRLKLGIVAV